MIIQPRNNLQFHQSYAMSEASPSNIVPVIEESKISAGEDESITYTMAEQDCSQENNELKEVEVDMELLELEESEASDSVLFHISSQTLKSPVSSPSTSNRRYTLRPQKRSETTECDKFKSPNEKRKVSLPKNGSLETIFENPVLKNGSLTLLGKAKMKRYLSFDSFVSKAKLRHRKLKLKRLVKGRKKKGNYKLTIEDVKRKLQDLDEEDDEWMDMQE